MNAFKIRQHDQGHDLMVAARQNRDAYLIGLLFGRDHTAEAKPRKHRESAIEPITNGPRPNRSTVNPLMLRGLAIS